MPELVHQGKVRDVFRDGNELLLVASDRISVFDVVLPAEIPDKGAILTAISAWWFRHLVGIPHHMISTEDVPPEFAGRAMRCLRLDMLPVEAVVRGYLDGSALKAYQETGSEVFGYKLPPGLRQGDRLPRPIFTPTTKAPAGEHDQPLAYDDVVDLIGRQAAHAISDLALEVYDQGTLATAGSGIIIADTKIELGRDRNGDFILADEVLTPDSSRFWPEATWQPGGPQESLDKQPVRDWAESTGWDKQPPGPEPPDHIVAATRGRYAEAHRAITGQPWR